MPNIADELDHIAHSLRTAAGVQDEGKQLADDLIEQIQTAMKSADRRRQMYAQGVAQRIESALYPYSSDIKVSVDYPEVADLVAGDENTMQIEVKLPSRDNLREALSTLAGIGLAVRSGRLLGDSIVYTLRIQ